MNALRPNGPVVIYVNGASYDHHGTPVTTQSSGSFAGSFAAYDPYEVARAFPGRWAGYIRGHYSNPLHVQQVFQVSERTAYRWWKGEGGAKGSHVAIAVREHPVEAPQMLFAAE